MHSLLKKSALLLMATVATAALTTAATAWHYMPSSCGWSTAAGDAPRFNGPTPDGPYYTGPYRGTFARLAYPEEAHCLMECRGRPSSWGGWQAYDVRVCRGVGRGSYTRRVRATLK